MPSPLSSKKPIKTLIPLPIALLLCLGKIFESLITKRITFWAERNNILAKGHFDGHAGRRTNDANLFLTSWIRKKWRDMKLVSALFLDVKSAFPSVMKEQLIDTMIKKNSPLYLSGISLNLLSNRTTSLRMEDYISPSFKLKCGLPQGSPLLPILYIIYNSSLLIGKHLNLNEDSISLGFIDNVTHLVADKDPETAILKLEKEGKRSLEWGTRQNAVFDWKKANFMLFNHQKLDVRPFKFGNISLPPSFSVKSLGIILNTKLPFKFHVNKVKKCGEQMVNQLARISCCSYGIGLRQSRNLIISMLCSCILFGSTIWATSRNKASIISLMKKIFNSASHTILGMFRTTPIEVLLRESLLMNFFDALKRKNHLFLIKKMIGPNSHPIKHLIKYGISHPETCHPSPIHSILDNQLIPSYHFDNIETIKQHLIKPWVNFTVNIKNFNIKKEDTKSVLKHQIEEISSRNKHLIFTDGLQIPEKGTALAAILNRTNKIACHIGDEDSALAFEAEVLAIELGLDIIINKIYNTQENFQQSSKSLNFFIENQATILSIASQPKPTSNQIVFHEIYTKMQLLMVIFNYSISLFWCPVHVNITENELVDALAKEATKGNLLRIHNFHRTHSNIQQLAKQNFKFDKKKKPVVRNNIKLVTYPSKFFESLNKLEQSKRSIIYQLRSGHSPLSNYLHQIKKLDTPDCTICKTTKDIHHFLIKYSQHKNKRKTF
jgi:ribonuclease HI